MPWIWVLNVAWNGAGASELLSWLAGWLGLLSISVSLCPGLWSEHFGLVSAPFVSALPGFAMALRSWGPDRAGMGP
jgi:hypothetical protein